METQRICSTCGKPLAPGVPEGLCPECLLKAGLGTGADIGPDTGGKAPRFTPPRIEELAVKFPQLEILEFIGQGGMGAVYQARQKQLDRVVALKILPPRADNAAFAERFTREARSLARLNHPHIVTLYEFGQSDGLFYFFMEFVDGVNLRQLLSNSRISPHEALAIVPQICEALQFAHDSGIVHRDIKPENILLDKKGQVNIADFGVAKMIAESLTDTAERATTTPGELTEAGSTLGTPQYMAPEQIKNSAEVDHRADIYSLGVVFYQMLTGELPSGKIEPPSRKVHIDVRLDEIVLRALEKKPELRFQQASDVKMAVETIAITPQPSLPETPAGFKHYKDSKWNFELDIPEGWNVFPPNHKNSMHELLRFASNENGKHLLILFRQPHNPAKSLKDVSNAVQIILVKAGFGNFVSAETTIGDRPAQTLDFDRPQAAGFWSCREYFIAEGTLAYTLGFGTTDKSALFETFDLMAKSFRFQVSSGSDEFKPYFPEIKTVAADEPKQGPGGQLQVPELGPEGFIARTESTNPQPARRSGMGAVFGCLAILLAFTAILLSVHKASVNASLRAASLENVLFHIRVFEADVGLVDQLIPASERQTGVQPNVKSSFAQGPLETSTYSAGNFQVITHGGETDSQIAPVSPTVVRSLIQGIAAKPGLLVDHTCLVSGIWWQAGHSGLADGWVYNRDDNSFLGNGGGNAFFSVRKKNGSTEVRIDGDLNHSVDTMIPGRGANPYGVNSRILYEGPLPQTNELVFLVPFLRRDGSQHYLVTVFDFNEQDKENEPQGQTGISLKADQDFGSPQSQANPPKAQNVLTEAAFLRKFDSNRIAEATITYSSTPGGAATITGKFIDTDANGKIVEQNGQPVEESFTTPNVLLTPAMENELLPSKNISINIANPMVNDIGYQLLLFLSIPIAFLFVIILVIYFFVRKTRERPVIPGPGAGANVKPTPGYTILRTIFIVAFAVEAIVSIVPDKTLIRTTLNYWLNTGGTDRLVNSVDLIHFCFRLGLLYWGWGIYNSLTFVVRFAFIALAITYPRRWVFIAGSIFAIYELLFGLLGPQNNEIQLALTCTVLTNIANVMGLAGFWVKPTLKLQSIGQKAEMEQPEWRFGIVGVIGFLAIALAAIAILLSAKATQPNHQNELSEAAFLQKFDSKQIAEAIIYKSYIPGGTATITGRFIETDANGIVRQNGRPVEENFIAPSIALTPTMETKLLASKNINIAKPQPVSGLSNLFLFIFIPTGLSLLFLIAFAIFGIYSFVRKTREPRS